jgi:hypothetical protein
METSIVSEWHKLFEAGPDNVEDDETSDYTGCHISNENIRRIWRMVHSDRHLHISRAYYVDILKGYVKLCVKYSERLPNG